MGLGPVRRHCGQLIAAMAPGRQENFPTRLGSCPQGRVNAVHCPSTPQTHQALPSSALMNINMEKTGFQTRGSLEINQWRRRFGKAIKYIQNSQNIP
jgi:hypothetical protein